MSFIVSRLNENGNVREWVELLLLILMNELLGFLGSREFLSHHSTAVYIGFKEKIRRSEMVLDSFMRGCVLHLQN